MIFLKTSILKYSPSYAKLQISFPNLDPLISPPITHVGATRDTGVFIRDYDPGEKVEQEMDSICSSYLIIYMFILLL